MSRPSIRLVIDTYPEMASLARRLYLADLDFRDLCEDFLAARAGIDGLAIRPDPASRLDVVEYRRLVNDLSEDIARYLRRMDRSSAGSASE